MNLRTTARSKGFPHRGSGLPRADPPGPAGGDGWADASPRASKSSTAARSSFPPAPAGARTAIPWQNGWSDSGERADEPLPRRHRQRLVRRRRSPWRSADPFLCEGNDPGRQQASRPGRGQPMPLVQAAGDRQLQLVAAPPRPGSVDCRGDLAVVDEFELSVVVAQDH